MRVYARFVVPLTLLSLLAFGPFTYLALTAQAPPTVEQAWNLLASSWRCAGAAWVVQLWLVAGAAPAARALAAGEQLSQLRALGLGARAMVRAIAPCALAVAAILLGALALVGPALALLVLLALVGASPEGPATARVRDSIAAVRAQLVPVAIVVIAMVTFDLALVVIAKLALTEPLMKGANKAELAGYRRLLDVVAFGIAAVSPLPVSLLANIRTRVIAA